MRLFNASLSIHGFLMSMVLRLPVNQRVLHTDQFSQVVANLQHLAGSIQVAFAFTVMAKVHGILEGVESRPRKELFAAIDPVMESVQYTDASMPRGGGPYWTTKDSHSLALIKQFSFIQGSQIDSIYREGAAFMEQRDNVKGIPCPKGLDQHQHVVLDLNPLFCGTVLLNFTLAVENAGVLVANHHLSVVFMAQLYNALQQKQLLNGEWQDIEDVIRSHLDSIFFGSRPTTAKQIHMRFALRKGLSMVDYSNEPRGERFGKVAVGVNANSSNSKRSSACLEVSKASRILNSMLDGEETTIRALFALNEQMEKDCTIKGKR